MTVKELNWTVGQRERFERLQVTLATSECELWDENGNDYIVQCNDVQYVASDEDWRIGEYVLNDEGTPEAIASAIVTDIECDRIDTLNDELSDVECDISDLEEQLEELHDRRNTLADELGELVK